MPLEGHWQTVNTPLRTLTARERNVVIAVLAVTAVAILGLLLIPSDEGRTRAAEGCIYTVVAGRTGGEPVHGCGAEAEAICAHAAQFSDPRADAIVAECRAQGVATTGEPGGPFSAKRIR
ncbi:MAG TPA: hypothetical protein VG898_08240 [Solirubrobacterales bacterium]|nr:hypothetical protein [Solirubrobacterales bacterium]